MNVRIFGVRAMKCMCAQTRPRFILSSERVLGGMEFEPMLIPREKSLLPENFPRGGSNPRRCEQRAQTLPTSYSGPVHLVYTRRATEQHTWSTHAELQTNTPGLHKLSYRATHLVYTGRATNQHTWPTQA